jgi:hypothetical protein
MHSEDKRINISSNGRIFKRKGVFVLKIQFPVALLFLRLFCQVVFLVAVQIHRIHMH